MVLHKYISAKYGFEFLCDMRLKISLPSEFNDPFEMIPRDTGVWTIPKIKKYFKDAARVERMYQYQKKIGNYKSKKAFKKDIEDKDGLAKKLFDKFNSMSNWENILDTKKKFDEVLRMICFSSETATETDQILLWSHYSQNHKGIRIHFDSSYLETRNTSLVNITYRKERSQLDYTLDTRDQKFIKQIEESFYTKSEAWKYEQEYRLFIDPELCSDKETETKKMLFVTVPIKSIIRVDLGAFAENWLTESIKFLKEKDNYNNVTFYKAKLDEIEFKLNYEKI